MGMRREIHRQLGRIEKKGQKPKKTHVTQMHIAFNIEEMSTTRHSLAKSDRLGIFGINKVDKLFHTSILVYFILC